MPEFVPVLEAHELPAGGCREVIAAGRPLALFNVSGTFHAISNVCLHRGGPLGQGVLDGAVVLCPWHAWSFDVTTGVSTVNPELKVQRFDVKVEDGQVFVKVE
jgi:nitrite reductase/ring-hydroxylating ferredoxin subunit